MPTTVYSQPQAVVFVASGGIPVVCVDANGQAIGDATTVVSNPLPVVETDATGQVKGDASRVFSTPWPVTPGTSGLFVVAVDSAGIPTGVAVGASSSIPLNVELIPDPTIAVSGNWVFSRSTFLNPGCQFNTTTQANLWLAVSNTQNQVLTPGTYRVSLTVANWISQTTFISVGVGSDAGGSSLTNGTINANTITGNGVWTVDIVVASNTIGQGVKLRESSGSGIQMDFTNISLKRIA